MNPVKHNSPEAPAGLTLTLSRPPWLRVWPNTFSTVQSCRGKARCPANLSPSASCSGLQRLACSSMSENRKNILGLASVPLRGTTFSQPSRTYHRPAGGTENIVVGEHPKTPRGVPVTPHFPPSPSHQGGMARRKETVRGERNQGNMSTPFRPLNHTERHTTAQ